MRNVLLWAPAVIMGTGAALVHGLIAPQRDIPLREPLAAVIPVEVGEYRSTDQEVTEEEATVAAFDDYLLRVYEPEDSSGAGWMSLYVGFYRSQTQGRTIHSPKNCLPGGGWEPLESRYEDVVVGEGDRYRVNHYILQRESERALVLYWYQGRGRIQSNEYAVKLDLLRDAALRHRTDEALVRVVTPLSGTEEEALERAMGLAREVIPAVFRALPE